MVVNGWAAARASVSHLLARGRSWRGARTDVTDMVKGKQVGREDE